MPEHLKPVLAAKGLDIDNLQPLTKDQIFEFFRRLADDNPSPETELEFGNPYQLVVAVALSAQSTDVGVNKATRRLFAEVRTPQDMIALGEDGPEAGFAGECGEWDRQCAPRGAGRQATLTARRFRDVAAGDPVGGPELHCLPRATRRATGEGGGGRRHPTRPPAPLVPQPR